MLAIKGVNFNRSYCFVKQRREVFSRFGILSATLDTASHFHRQTMPRRYPARLRRLVELAFPGDSQNDPTLLRPAPHGKLSFHARESHS
jgi:hypothetical protein